MVAGGDYPDLLPVMEYYTGGLSKAYEDGVIVDINDYMDDNMPNYLAVRDCLDEKTVKATLTEDMTLAFYQIKDGTYSGNGLVSRADWIRRRALSSPAMSLAWTSSPTICAPSMTPTTAPTPSICMTAPWALRLHLTPSCLF